MSIERNRVYCMDALELLRQMDDASVHLMLTDPPYNVGKAAWDSWPTNDAYLAWLDSILSEMRRVIAPNGSLYLFCAPRLAARVELAVGRHFNVLTRITWETPPFSTKAEMFDKDTMRAYFPASEVVVFAEQHQADYLANGVAFTSLKAWFRDRGKAAGIAPKCSMNAWAFRQRAAEWPGQSSATKTNLSCRRLSCTGAYSGHIQAYLVGIMATCAVNIRV